MFNQLFSLQIFYNLGKGKVVLSLGIPTISTSFGGSFLKRAQFLEIIMSVLIRFKPFKKMSV